MSLRKEKHLHRTLGIVQKVVNEIADEGFCWRYLESGPAEASRCYESLVQTQDVLRQSFEQRDALSFQNEYSDEV